MIKHDKIAMTFPRVPQSHTGLIEWIIRVLCARIGCDVDFVPYGHPYDYVPIQIDCACGHTVYGRIDTFNTMGVQCPSCQKQYSVYSDGEKCWFMMGFMKAEEWPGWAKGENDARPTDSRNTTSRKGRAENIVY